MAFGATLQALLPRFQYSGPRVDPQSVSIGSRPRPGYVLRLGGSDAREPGENSVNIFRLSEREVQSESGGCVEILQHLIAMLCRNHYTQIGHQRRPWCLFPFFGPLATIRVNIFREVKSAVHRLACLLHFFFRRCLATPPSRFTNPSPPWGWVKGFHLQTLEPAPAPIKKTAQL